VPWDDPDLIGELKRLPYPQRGGLARLLAGLRRDRPRGRANAMDVALE
jgi:hypothetical protein